MKMYTALVKRLQRKREGKDREEGGNTWKSVSFVGKRMKN